MTDIILFGIILMQATVHFIERRDLYRRIMSDDISDYRHKPNKKTRQSRHSEVLGEWRKG